MFKRAPKIVIKPPVLQEPEAFKGGDFTSGLQSEYTPFVSASLVTLLISILDLTMTWLVFRYVKSLRVRRWMDEWSRAENEDNLWDMSDLYKHLQKLFLAFSVIASAVHSWYVIHFGLLFYYKRRKFYETRDGVTFEWTFIEHYNGEVCILLLAVLHNLPIMLLLLALQAMVSCEFLILTQVPVIYACVIATIISIVYKLIQVIWNAGCCGKNDHYTRSRCHSSLRIITIVILIGTLTITSINLVLLKPLKNFKNLPRNDRDSPHPLFDKVYIDEWMNEDKIMLYEHVVTSNNGDEYNVNSNEYANYETSVEIMNIDELVHDHNKVLTVSRPCSMYSLNMTMYLPLPMHHMHDQNPDASCQVVFNIYFDLHNHTLYMDYRYKLMSRDQTQCFSGHFMPAVAMEDTGLPQRSRSPSAPSSEESGRDDDSDVSDVDDGDTRTVASTSAQTSMMTHEMCFLSSITTLDVSVPCHIVVTQELRHEFVDPCLGVTSES